MDRESLRTVLSQFQPLELQKGEYLLQSGTVCRKLAFIDAGYVRMYDTADGKEITLWIGGKGRFVTSVSSFVFQTSNYWNIQAVTDCSLYTLDRDRHERLGKDIPKWLEFDNALLAQAFALLEQSMFAQLHTTAMERLEHLMDSDPGIFNHVPLQYIASMIGITPESLSRLRKQLAMPKT